MTKELKQKLREAILTKVASLYSYGVPVTYENHLLAGVGLYDEVIAMLEAEQERPGDKCHHSYVLHDTEIGRVRCQLCGFETIHDAKLAERERGEEAITSRQVCNDCHLRQIVPATAETYFCHLCGTENKTVEPVETERGEE